jgi:iron complex outermembrane receptor protein
MKLPPPLPPLAGPAGALLACWALAAQGQTVGANLTDLSLEQLSSIEVTSVGKRVQRLADVPGSVFVIHQEDIRRSGAITLPEVLRLAPNLQVARADANQYAITARGFNSVLANKMLVLVDGRTIYSPLFSGVFWEVQDMVLDDVERIEVLSGAGGTLYGSNAVNGVINIITRSAAETTGALVKLAPGNQERAAAARWGAATEAGWPWRIYAKTYRSDASVLANRSSVGDASRRSQAGFRTDRAEGSEQITVQGDIYESRIDQLPDERRLSGANLLARWSRETGAGSRTQLQAYFDRANRDQPGAVDDTLDTWDIELQQTSRPAAGHDLLWGAGYRWQQDSLVNLAPAALLFTPAERRMHLWNLFGQDEFALTPQLRVTLGLKAEHNSYTGLEWLPTARLAWQFAPDNLLWATASRAVRTPSRIDRDIVLPALGLGSSNFVSEVARVFELGYRAQPDKSVSYSATLFHHQFDRLRSIDLLPAGIAFGNSFRGHLTGLEAWSTWRVADQWRLQAGYVHQRLRLAAQPGRSVAPGNEAQLGNDPRNRALLGVGWDLSSTMEVDLQARYVGSLPTPAVPRYTAIDLRWGWRLRPDLELSLAVRSLNDPRHPEWGTGGVRAEIPRSVLLKAVWRM